MVDINSGIAGIHVLEQTTKESHGFTRDAARPFIVIEIYYRGYRSGLKRTILSRWETRKQAMAARRRAINRF